VGPRRRVVSAGRKLSARLMRRRASGWGSSQSSLAPAGASSRASSRGLASVPGPSFSGRIAPKALLFEGGARAFAEDYRGWGQAKSASRALARSVVRWTAHPNPDSRLQATPTTMLCCATGHSDTRPRRCRFRPWPWRVYPVRPRKARCSRGGYGGDARPCTVWRRAHRQARSAPVG
jgi:hypothetical protein